MCEQSYRKIKRKIVGLIYLKYLRKKVKIRVQCLG